MKRVPCSPMTSPPPLPARAPEVPCLAPLLPPPPPPWVGEAEVRRVDSLRSPATNAPSRYELADKNSRAALDRIDPAQDADSAAMYAYQIGRVYEKQERLDLAVKQYYTLLYAAAARTAEAYTAEGRRWLDKARTRLESI